jgi:hypothetical protein
VVDREHRSIAAPDGHAVGDERRGTGCRCRRARRWLECWIDVDDVRSLAI